MKLALEYGFSNLKVESDSEMVINDQAKHNSYLSSLLVKIMGLVPLFSSISFRHVYRDVNKVTHTIAKYFHSVGDEVWVSSFPICFNACIRLDILTFIFQ